METIVINPRDKKQAVAIKKILRALDIPFEKPEIPYDPAFVEKIRQSDQEIKEGKTVTFSKVEELDQYIRSL
jgi:hypothetical protein